MSVPFQSAACPTHFILFRVRRTTLDDNTWINKSRTSAHPVFGSSERKIII